MIKTLGKLTLATILAATVIGMPLNVPAQTNTNKVAATTKMHGGLPFHGKVGMVDATAGTVTLSDKNKRVFAVTSETKITKAGVAATISDISVGTEISGSYTKDADGKLTAKSIKIQAVGK